jgi:hypothetical protein
LTRFAARERSNLRLDRQSALAAPTRRAKERFEEKSISKSSVALIDVLEATVRL